MKKRLNNLSVRTNDEYGFVDALNYHVYYMEEKWKLTI